MERNTHQNGFGDRRVRPMRIGVYGLGYVGAVSAACLAELGHDVVGVDVNPDKVSAIQAGRGPVREPGLDELLEAQVSDGRLSATTDGLGVAATVEVVMLAVGTPSTTSGGVDASQMLRAAGEIGAGLRQNPADFVAVVNRSTMLPSVHDELIAELETASGRTLGTSLGYACHPEFLRETTALSDFRQPPYIVFGCDGGQTTSVCHALYPDLGVPVLDVPIGEAALVKYASNCWHAVKVTFANEIGELCRRHGLDARSVMDLMCMDDHLNISAKYLRPGNPFGGSCLPKDLRAVIDFARRDAAALPMLSGTLLSNANQLDALAERILALRPTKVGVIGLSFKEGTDDLREAPMVPVVERLIGKGVTVEIYDAGLAVSELVGANAAYALASVPHLADLVGPSLPDVVAAADCIVVNHRLDGRVDWAQVLIDDRTHVLDLVGVPGLADKPRYEGLYWGGAGVGAIAPA